MFKIENITLGSVMDVVKYGTAYEILKRGSDEIIVAGKQNPNEPFNNLDLKESIVSCVSIYGDGLRIEIE